MENVPDPTYALAITALKELIAHRVCTAGSVDFTKGEIVLFYHWPWGALFWVKTNKTNARERKTGRASGKKDVPLSSWSGFDTVVKRSRGKLM